MRMQAPSPSFPKSRPGHETRQPFSAAGGSSNAIRSVLEHIAATPEQEAATREVQRRYSLGYDAGMAGLPRPPDGNEFAYRRGSLKRLGRRGEAVIVVMEGCRCRKCGAEAYGWRLGCRCWTAEDLAGQSAAMDWGLLVYPMSDDEQAPLVLMTRAELLAARAEGKRVLDSQTGEPVQFGDAT